MQAAFSHAETRGQFRGQLLQPIRVDVQRAQVARVNAEQQLAGGGAATGAAPPPAPAAEAATPEPAGEAMAPWINSDDCTSCDECIKINSKLFAYDERKKAYIADPQAGPYRDLVVAAEKCTARVIHPGLPADRSGAGVEDLIRRGEKFN